MCESLNICMISLHHQVCIEHVAVQKLKSDSARTAAAADSAMMVTSSCRLQILKTMHLSPMAKVIITCVVLYCSDPDTVSCPAPLDIHVFLVPLLASYLYGAIPA